MSHAAVPTIPVVAASARPLTASRLASSAMDAASGIASSNPRAAITARNVRVAVYTAR
jgi:hypothetical protein